MGKGTIISGGDKGQYTIDIVYNSVAYDREIALLDQQIADLQAKYDNAPETTAEEKIAKSILKLQLTSLNKRKENLQSAYSGSTQRTVWCADLTEDLSGDVGTIEVPGESTNMQIQPGYESNANYDSNRDGQLQLSYNMDYAGLFYNLAMLPGWQKWKPLFRYGTITAINNSLADVTIEDIKSSQQALSINQTNTLTGVGFEYMTCDDAAFSVGDEVLIKFEGQDWTNPKIIGFKDNPKACGGYLYVSNGDLCFVWDLETNTYATGIKDNNGDDAAFPVASSQISDYLSSFSQVATPAVSVTPKVSPYFKPGTYQDGRTTGTVVEEEGECCSSEETTWDKQYSAICYTPEGEKNKKYTYRRNRRRYGFAFLDNSNFKEVIIDNTDIFNPFYNVNYKITSNTNIKQVKGRNVIYDFSSFCVDTLMWLEPSAGSSACSSLSGEGREESRDKQSFTQIRTYSPFSDKTVQMVKLEDNVDISATFSIIYEEYINLSGKHFLTLKEEESDCHVHTRHQAVVQFGYNVNGVIGNKAVPYVIVFYTEFIETQITTNDICGYFPNPYTGSEWRSCTEDGINSIYDEIRAHPEISCYPYKTNVVKTPQIEVCEVKVFSEKDTNGDPMNLNPFELPENSDLQTAMKELSDSGSMGFSMSFLQ